MTTTTHDTRQGIGFRRWILLGLMVLGGLMAFNIGGFWGGLWKPVAPAVVLPAEAAWPGAPITNTMLSTLVASLILFALTVIPVQLFMRGGGNIPAGFYNAIELGVEFFWDTTQSAAGKWARRIFPFTMTILLYVAVVNLFKLVPIHETFGYMEQTQGKGYQTVSWNGLQLLDGSQPGKPAAAAAGGEGEARVWTEAGPCPNCILVPFFRGSATDLNFTFALSLTTMLLVQIFGVWALGLGYFTKFINLTTIVNKPFFGLMDFIVGLLELISEFAKVLSFGLRLFGVIFAGTLLLAILGSLTVVFIPGMLVGLELFVGLIQAYVFSTLALTFMSQATVSHHGDEHSDAH